MYSDKRRSGAFCESGGDNDKCFPYSILSKQQQQQHAAVGQGLKSYPGTVLPLSTTSSPLNTHPASAASSSGSNFYTNAMVTDVGICFSMSNVNLNSDLPPYLGHPSLSLLGKGVSDSASAPPSATSSTTPPVVGKYRPTPVFKPRTFAPAANMAPHPTAGSVPPYSLPYAPYYFAHPKIPIKIYNNRTYPYLPTTATTASSAAVAAAYGEQLNNYFTYARLPPPSTEPSEYVLNRGRPRRNARRTLLNNQYYDICMKKCTNAVNGMFQSPEDQKPKESRVAPSHRPQSESPINVDMDEPEDPKVQYGRHTGLLVSQPPSPPSAPLPSLPLSLRLSEVVAQTSLAATCVQGEDDDDDQPKDFSMKRRTSPDEDEAEYAGVGDNSNGSSSSSSSSSTSSGSSSSSPLADTEFDERTSPPAQDFCRRTAAPKKKWIRHYLMDEPLVNGHSSAPPLVVISTNGSNSSSSSTSSSTNSSNNHQKHLPAASPSLTIDLSTKTTAGVQISAGSGPHVHLSSTPPSSGCSSTLTISPVDDSQSSLNLSSGSSGYITSHSANSSSSLNLSGSNSGSSPLPTTAGAAAGLNGGVLAATTHVPANTSPLPHDLVIVQQQQQQLSHLMQAGQQGLGLTSTATLLNHIPTGGRRRTTSSTSNGVGTREVHNKLEKNRRAHLKECFEQLKKQLTLQPEEKKTSNLSILHAAIRYIQLLKRKEREYEHEMERLAKEKIAAQNRILQLKRELPQWGDVDFSCLAPDTDAIPHSSSSSSGGSNSVQSDRDLLNDPVGVVPGRNGIRYSSSSSLSSVATTASISNLPLQTTISPVLIAASSPTRASPPSLSVTRNASSPATGAGLQMPLSLTTKVCPSSVPDTHNGTSSPLKFTTTSLPNGLNLSATSIANSGASGILSTSGASSGGSSCSTPSSTNGGSTGTISSSINGTSLPLIVGANNRSSLAQSQLFTPVTATLLTTSSGTAIQTLPLNLNVASTGSTNGSNNHHLLSSSSSSGSPSVVSISNGIASTASGLQIIGTTTNGTTIPASLVTSAAGKELLNGVTLPKNGLRTAESNKIEIIATQTGTGSSLDPPATKVIKLVNGNTIVGLTSVDKDKMMLSQVVQQGGLVVSPIQLLTSAQGLRVIQQAPNGLATIELSTPTNVQAQSSSVHRTTGGNASSGTSHLTSHKPSSSQPNATSTLHPQQHIQQVTSAQLHKLLISSSAAGAAGSTLNGLTTSSGGIGSSNTGAYTTNGASSVVSTTTITPELARLPGGAELNILPAGTNGATALPLYRTTTGPTGKLAFVNAISTAGNSTALTLKSAETTTSGTGRTTAVHVVTPIQTSTAQRSSLGPVVVSRYEQDSALPGLFTTVAAGTAQAAQLGKVGALVSRN